MAVSYRNSRTISVGPVRVIMTRIDTSGSNETMAGIPVYAASTTVHRAFAITRTPLSDGSENANIRVTAVANERPTFTIDGGASGDQFALGIWSW